MYISILNSHLAIPMFCKKGIPFNQVERYRRITSNEDCFKYCLERRNTYFQKRNYPTDILS